MFRRNLKFSLYCGLAVLLSASMSHIHAQTYGTPSASSYLGGSVTTDYVAGTEIQADGNIVIAANISSARPGNLNPVLLNGATSSTSGAIVRLSADGRSVLSVTRLAAEVRDISLDSSGNIYVAARAAGLFKLNSTASSIIWSKANGGSADRVDAAPNGYSVTLKMVTDDGGWNATGAGTLYVYDASGNQVGSFAGHNRTMDVAIDSASQSVYAIGYQNKNSPYNPVQVCYVRSSSYTGTQKWKSYDWSGAQVDSPNENNMADTRGVRIEIGDDGYLYGLFMSAGGNHIFRRDPFNLTKAVTIVGGDKYHDFYNTKAEHKTFFGKYNPGTGAYIQGQQFCARLTTGAGNTAWCERGNIKADSAGRVMIVGGAGSGGGTNNTNLGLPFSFNPVPSGEYGGGPFVLVMSSNFASRLFCGRISSGGYMHAAAIRVVNSKANFVFGGYGTSTTVYTTSAIQSSASTLNDGMFAVVLDGGSTANPAPTVSITFPSSGATFNAPASIGINASASDSNGTVSKVEFFRGTTAIATDTTSPYSVTWNSVAAGSYSLTARATDNGGAATTSAAVNVTVNGTTSGGTVLHRINAGGAAVSPYTADANFSGGTAASSTATIDLSGVTSPAPAAVYQTERYGNCTYTFGSLTANTAHTVRLHFAETWHSGPGLRKFDVSINGTQVLNDYDVYAAAGAKNKAVITQHTVNANASGQIVIQFTNVVENAKINGIEIIKN